MMKQIIDIYQKSRTPDLDQIEFQNPSAVYRGAPFWSWNNKLNLGQLKRQIDCLKEMGMGGFHIHPRSGLDTEYLGADFLAVAKACVIHAKKVGMLSWLYDEDRWPSGAAGGLVTRDHQFRARHLLFTCKPYSGQKGRGDADSRSRGTRMDNENLLARYDVLLSPDGSLSAYRRLNADETPQGKLWYAYLEIAGDSPWFNNQAYVDTLNPKAIQKFIEVTHTRYYHTLKEYFGRDVPAIFTDEPQFVYKGQFRTAHDERDVFLPWTDDFPETFAKAHGQNIEDALPELFWELPEHRASLARYRYHDHIAERFAVAFADTVGKWCEKHGIALTGHMMAESTLQSQTAAIGDCMRSYRGFHIPGIDMLCDRREYTTAKQAQSATHQYGRPGVLSELYGVTNWDFPFSGHKGQGDWQAALGVTVRVHHLAWVSMAGEAKRDFPASISYQSPWFREYPLVEDHFARLNTVLTRGKPGVRIGVIHPVESYWLCFGPMEQTKMERSSRDFNFQQLTEWLLFGLLDFNFICEALLPAQTRKQEGKTFNVCQMAYDMVIVPGMRTIRSTTIKRLEAFAKAGGTIIFMGEIPSLIDAEPSIRAQRLAKKSLCIDYSRMAIVEALAPVRDVEVRLADGGYADTLLYQLRLDGEKRSIFICNTDRAEPRYGARIKLRGDWSIELMDTFSGKTSPCMSHREGDWTILAWDFDAYGHVLLSLTKGWKPLPPETAVARKNWNEVARLEDPVAITLSEPNVLLLDQAQWKINDDAWEPVEEVLRLENMVRARLGLGSRDGREAQPWTDHQPKEVLGQVTIRFKIETDIDIVGAELAMEDAGLRTIQLDGVPMKSVVAGFYVDEAIGRVKLPTITSGQHTLDVTMPYHRKTNIECHYLLGDFGVRAMGRYAKITEPVRQLMFGDTTSQGLPFYTGNITYHCKVSGTGSPLALRAPHFKVPLLSVALDGKVAGKIAFAPFRLDLGEVGVGSHDLDITAFGHRFNSFGCLHWVNPGSWAGLNAWRTIGDAWSYEYQFKPMGILVSPMLETI